jgi:hypothetical protein
MVIRVHASLVFSWLQRSALEDLALMIRGRSVGTRVGTRCVPSRKRRGQPDDALPNFVSVGGQTFGAGYAGRL